MSRTAKVVCEFCRERTDLASCPWNMAWRIYFFQFFRYTGFLRSADIVLVRKMMSALIKRKHFAACGVTGVKRETQACPWEWDSYGNPMGKVP